MNLQSFQLRGRHINLNGHIFSFFQDSDVILKLSSTKCDDLLLKYYDLINKTTFAMWWENQEKGEEKLGEHKF